VLRGEPLVPLTDVSFAEEAGRGREAAARVVLELPRLEPTRKRATAAAEVGVER
jgi:hypothetical protein